MEKCKAKNSGNYDYDVVVRFKFDWDRTNKKAPEGNIYNISTDEHLEIVAHNWAEIQNFDNSGITTMWTSKRITDSENRFITGFEAFGNIVISVRNNPTTLAHELGHVVGYVGDIPDDPGHSSEDNNLMNAFGGSEPDCQYCQRVWEFAKWKFDS